MWFMPVNNHTLERLRQEDFEANKQTKNKNKKKNPNPPKSRHCMGELLQGSEIHMETVTNPSLRLSEGYMAPKVDLPVEGWT